MYAGNATFRNKRHKSKLRQKHSNYLLLNRYISLATSFDLQSHHQAILNRISVGTYINRAPYGLMMTSSSSSSGPGAYAPDAPQPVGLLCYPCTALVF
jgi:hypothetical protein